MAFLSILSSPYTLLSMSDPVLDFQSAPVNSGGMPTALMNVETAKDVATLPIEGVSISAAHNLGDDLYDGAEGLPTQEEMSTLRLVAAPIP